MTPANTKEAIVEEFRIRSIQEAAIKIIGRKGVSGASMQEIADTAGISKGTIYLYFQNQEELLERTADFMFSRLKERVFAAFDSEGTFADQFRMLLRVQIEFFNEHSDFLRAYGAMKADDQKCARITKPQYQAYIQRFGKFLSDAMRKGEIRATHPQRLAVFLSEGVGSMLFLRIDEKNRPDVDEEVEWISSMVLDGLARKGNKK
jgi:AcrR family transcriptional regulator